MKHFLLSFIAFASGLVSEAASVKVTMNTVSTTMSMVERESKESVDVGTPENKVYTFTAPAGAYVLTAYGANGTTVNGTIVLNITDTEEEQEFKVLTCTAYATNSGWTVDDDYTFDVTVNTREGERQTITVGESTTSGRKTFLALNGNSYTAAFVPSEARVAEGYTTLYKSGTLTSSVNVNGAIPQGSDFTVTVPADANLTIGMKFTHFTDFTPVKPTAEETDGDSKRYTYYLANNQVYNYRTWTQDGLTQAGYFTMSTDAAKCPTLAFTADDYKAYDPHQVNHDPQSNKGYETGDIFVNINPQGHLRLNVGDTFDTHAMRTWELTDNSVNNYFIEPDFHYAVIDTEGKPSTGVIEIDNADTHGSPWSKITAVGNGTAIVLVTYDAIDLNYYSGQTKKEYLGGEYWGAIWPENTGVYVVTVGEEASSAVPNMTINKGYNTGALKMAGENVDAEHDVFYYLDTEEGARYTFTPDGVSDIAIAYPTIGDRTVTYSGFGTEGVTSNGDGSYTLLLKHGRQIVRMTDADGNATYQVLTAKKCHREIANETREGSKIFLPGDKVKIQYDGLFHPANKLAGIYNMSAYVTYNGTPNGSSLILGKGQYTFGSAASAQAVSVNIPADYDVESEPYFAMTDGVIQVNGFGDPIGNHRTISPLAGRSPNFTAVAHKTYFGAIPEVRIPVFARKETAIVSVDDKGIATYCPALGADFSGATKIAAYKASVSDNTVILTKVTTVAAGEGVLIRSLTGDAAEEELPTMIEAAENEGNAFVGTLEAITLNETDGNCTNFVLYGQNSAVGFYKANKTHVDAGKAYLPIEDSGAATALRLAFSDEATGIGYVEAEKAAQDNETYTLGGVRVKNPAKGIFIKNGKKVTVK